MIYNEGVFAIYEVDERDGLRQVGPDFEAFEAATGHALSLSDARRENTTEWVRQCWTLRLLAEPTYERDLL